MKQLLDLHVYTNNSPCGHDKISFLCEHAVRRGLRAVAFTDVFAADAPNREEGILRLRHAAFDASKARRLFADALMVFRGVELEQAVADPAFCNRLIQKSGYDIVLSAVTRRRDGTPFAAEADAAQAQKAAFAGEYAALLTETIETTEFDVLSRLLAPLRPLRGDLSVFSAALDAPLALLAQKERALEIDAKDMIGSERIRDLYYELMRTFYSHGGRRITIGSESRCFEELGAGIEVSAAAAKRAGFKHLTFYEMRFPYELEL